MQWTRVARPAIVALVAVVLVGCSGSDPEGVDVLPTNMREACQDLNLADLEPASRKEAGLARDAAVAALQRYEVRGSGLGRCGEHWVVGIDVRGEVDETDRTFVQDGVPVVLLAARDIVPFTDEP